MKLRDGFITYEADGEHLMVTTGSTAFNGLVKSNKTAAFIVECLKEDTSEAEILDKMSAKYDAPRDVMSADLKKIIETMREIGAIDE